VTAARQRWAFFPRGENSMPTSAMPFERPVLVASSFPADALVLRAALDGVGLPMALAADAVTAMHAVCGQPGALAGIVAGDRVGRVSGLTLCGLARDAGCNLPILLMTTDDCGTIALRAARLRVTVLWQPVSARRLENALRSLFSQRRQCMAS
jgi:CheY-like chemotaxis protein